MKEELRQLPNGSFIKVTYGLRKFPHQSSYFSITGEYNGSYGCIHNTIIKHCPDLKDLIQFHLVDCNGRRIHYIANAIYWAELAAGISQWQNTANIPNDYSSYADVFLSHCVIIDENDKRELTLALAGFRLTGNLYKTAARIDLEKFLHSREELLLQHMQNVMAKHGIEIPSE